MVRKPQTGAAGHAPAHARAGPGRPSGGRSHPPPAPQRRDVSSATGCHATACLPVRPAGGTASRETGSVASAGRRSEVHAILTRFQGPSTRHTRRRWSARVGSLRGHQLAPSRNGSHDTNGQRRVGREHLDLIAYPYQHTSGGRVVLRIRARNDQRTRRRDVLRRYLHDRGRQPLRHDRARPSGQLLQHRCRSPRGARPGIGWAHPVG
jgi:hypothetical protein